MPIDSSTQITLSLTNGSYTVWDEDRGETSGQGSVKEVYSRDWAQNRAEWNLLCRWSDRISIAFGIVGGGSIIAGQPYNTPPLYYPDLNWLPASRVECSGVGKQSVGPNGAIAFEYARLRSIFSPDPSLSGELSLDFAATALALDGTQPSFKWAGGSDVPPSQTPSIQVTTLQASLLLLRKPQLNQVLIASLVDCVNTSTFQGFGSQRVLFKGGRSNRRLTMDGTLNYDLQLNFEFSGSAWNWNQMYKAGSGWTNFFLPDGTTKFFPLQDFSPLLA